MFEKLPPHSIEAEEAVLGACLLDPEAIDKALSILSVGDFYRPSNQKIFECLSAINAKGQKADAVLLQEALKIQGDLEAIGGAVFIGHLMDKTPSSANVEHYAIIVFDKSRRRKLITASSNIVAAAYTEDDESIYDKAENSILKACEENGLNKTVHVHESMPSVIDRLEQYSKNPGMLTGVTTGFKELDIATTGFHGGELIIVAGRPGMGKTALCLDMARLAAKKGTPVTVYSLEMTTGSLITRMLCAESGLDSRKLARGTASSYERAMLTKDINTISSLPLRINDESVMDIQRLRAMIRREVKEHKIGMAVVDYIQLMDVSGKTENRQQEITKISRGLKSIAKELNIPLIVASQLSRATEAREKSKPRLSDLRESGAIEQDADAVFLIYRPDYYDKNGDDRTATIDIAKQRNGPTGEVKLLFENQSTTFKDLDERPLGQ